LYPKRKVYPNKNTKKHTFPIVLPMPLYCLSRSDLIAFMGGVDSNHKGVGNISQKYKTENLA